MSLTQNKLEPVSVFWDIENCAVPADKSAFALATIMRKEFIKGKRETEFMCACDITKQKKEVIEELNKAQVCTILCIPFYLYWYQSIHKMDKRVKMMGNVLQWHDNCNLIQ